MSFHISGLAAESFAPLFELSDAELASRNIVRRVVDTNPGFPCRVSLRDAAVGETVLLLNYEHLNVATPYRSSHAIFVRQDAQEARLAPGEIPDVLRLRLLSVRAFDHEGMMVGAEVVQGRELESTIAQLFSNPQAAYLHAHNAKPGCFAAHIHRCER
jgi:hypothetical protein